MEPGSRIGHSIKPSPHLLASFMGTVIALLTLTVPLLTIAHFSSTAPPNWQSSQEWLSRME